MNDIEKIATELQMSPTIGRLCRIAQDCPIDVKDPEELKQALATTALHVVDGLDNGSIRCETNESAAMVHAVLALALDFVLDGDLSNSETHRVQ